MKKFVVGEIMSGKILCRKGYRGETGWKCFPFTSPWLPMFFSLEAAEGRIDTLNKAGTPSVFIAFLGAHLREKVWRDFCAPQRDARTCL
jgi:hypothetical protein